MNRVRLVAAFAVVLAVAGLSACSSSKSGGGGAGAGGSSKNGTIVMITPNRVGVNEFLKVAVKGIKDAAAATGTKSQVFESSDPQTMRQNLDAAIRIKPKVIVAVSFQFTDLMTTVPKDHPDQQFLLVDACPPSPAANLTCAMFKEHEATFLAGAEAGMLTKANKVGAVVALDSPFLRRFSDPFGEGAKQVNPQVSFKALFVGGSNAFSDPARAKEEALSIAAGGADYVMASAAAGNFGVFEAAKQQNFKAFGVDVNQCPSAPGYVVDNVIKKVDVATTKGVRDIIAGKRGGAKVYGLADGGVTVSALEPGLDSSQCLIAKQPDIVTKIKALKEDIISGRVKVTDPAGQG